MRTKTIDEILHDVKDRIESDAEYMMVNSERFLDFFVQRGHKEVSSHAVIPPDAPTLYFVNAGMVQFKDIFVGARQVDYKTDASCQK